MRVGKDTAYSSNPNLAIVKFQIALLCMRFVRAQLYEITSASPIIVFGAILTLLWLRLWPDSFRHDALHRLNRPRHCEQSGLSAVAEEYGTATTDHRSHFCDLRVLVVIIGGVAGDTETRKI